MNKNSKSIYIFFINLIGYFCNFIENFNNLSLYFIIRSKIKTIDLLKKLKYPTTTMIDRKNININDFIVAKPIKGTRGKGIYFKYPGKKLPLNIYNNKNYFFEFFEKGKNYRIILYNNKVITVFKRIIPFVIGDGINNVLTLVNKENKFRSSKNKMIIQKEKENIIPKKDAKYKVNHLSNYSTGGSLKNVLIDSIPKETLNLFVNLQKDLRLKILSIDLICSDIKKEIGNQKVFCINELEFANDWDVNFILQDNFSILGKKLILKNIIIIIILIIIIRKILKNRNKF